ncbi:MAG: hypothetical protein JWO43_635 [Candidatus Adlerbacteria bacterium]|nr:hypothetical protein [Candidatus Adlerbacteria bacterium]
MYRKNLILEKPFAARRREKSKFSAENYVCFSGIRFLQLYRNKNLEYQPAMLFWTFLTAVRYTPRSAIAARNPQ